MDKRIFGQDTFGNTVNIYTIGNDECYAKILDFGAIIQALTLFGRDIVGGFDSMDQYIADDSHQGGTIGRVANRIENASFNMDGNEYFLPDNDNGSCLHGGCGFDRRMWTVKEHSGNSITLSYLSADGEEGFPSLVYTEVTYTMIGSDLIIDYKARTDNKTPISLTNHSYFNLDGFGDDIMSHKVRIFADKYTAVNEKLIPIDDIAVDNTPFDLREEKEIGYYGVDYDHNFIIKSNVKKIFGGKALTLAAIASNGETEMSVYTDQPCIQFYIGNFLGSGPDFKNGIKQIKHGAFCMEAQAKPNSVKSGGIFYDRNKIYTHTTVYSFKKV